VFDPIFCGPNASITELKLNYYIYFWGDIWKILILKIILKFLMITQK
jgi:hypothetical protein